MSADPSPNPVEASGPSTSSLSPFVPIARWYFGAAVVWLVIGLFAGFTYALQFIEGWGDKLIPPSPVHGAGRLRTVHSSIMIYGFLLNVMLGAFHGLPIHARSPGVFRIRFLKLAFWLGQIFLFFGIGSMFYGHIQPLLWGEMPVWSDLSLAALWAAIFGSLLSGDTPLDRPHLLASHRYLCLAGIFGVLSHALWAVLPEFVLSGARSSFAAGFFQAHLINAFLFPLAIGLGLHYVPELAGRRPRGTNIARLCLGGFLILGPLANAQLYAVPGPTGILTQFTTLASRAYPLVLVGVLGSLFLTVWGPRGNGYGLSKSERRSLRWFLVGAAAALWVSVERLLLTHPPFLRSVQFTDWTVGHHHLIFMGVFGSWAFGWMEGLWPKFRGYDGWPSPQLATFHFVLTTVGMALMVIALDGAGWVQSNLWREMAPWSDALHRSQPFWLMRIGAGVLIILGQLCFLANVLPMIGGRTSNATPLESRLGAEETAP